MQKAKSKKQKAKKKNKKKQQITKHNAILFNMYYGIYQIS
jgi:hypothetical protein